MLCVEFNKGKMTIREARKNLQELVTTRSEDITDEELAHLFDLHFSEDLEATMKEEEDNG